MATTALYEGVRKDVKLYYNKDVVSFVFAVFNKDATDYSFTGIASATLNIYKDSTRKQTLVTLTDSGGAISQSSNDLTLTIDWSTDISTTLKQGEVYWWDLSWIDATPNDRLLSFGDCFVE